MADSGQIIKLIGLILVVAIASSLLVWVGDLKITLIGLMMMVAMAYSFRYPRAGLWALLIYLPFGGTIAYSVAKIYHSVGGGISYTAAYPLFHLAKDAFYFPALVGILWFTTTLKPFMIRFKPFVGISLGLLGSAVLTLLFVNGFQALSTQAPQPLLMGLIGFKILLGYVPLSLCAYYLIGERRDLQHLMRLQVVLVLICCSLCLVQYSLLVTGICPGNSELAEPAVTRASLQARCFVGGSLLYNPSRALIRLPGTFVSPWQWGWFLIANSFLIYGAGQMETARRWRWLIRLAAVMLLGVSIISGQRVAFLTVPLIFMLLLLLTEHNKPWLVIKLSGFTTLLLILGGKWELLQQRFDSLIGRWTDGPPDQFIIEQFQQALGSGSGWLGLGLGKATSAARTLGDIRLIETHYARLLYEIGWLGTLLFLAVVSVLTWLTWRSLNQVKERSLRQLGRCLWLFVVFMSYNTYYYPLAVDPVAVYYWFFAGVLLKFPQLETPEPQLSRSISTNDGSLYPAVD